VGERLLRELNSKLREELLAAEQFSTLYEAKVLIEQCGATTVRSDRIPRSAIVRRRLKRFCRQRLPCPTLRSGQPRRWPTAAGL
jgi:hypothetical protein